ncbi:13009_t:CDS:2 [Rhizophagus irregularis]|nr:13009_t:CDS:2 [Rhizophagus irregularis]
MPRSPSSKKTSLSNLPEDMPKITMPFPPKMTAEEFLRSRPLSRAYFRSPNSFFIYRQQFVKQLKLENYNDQMVKVSKWAEFDSPVYDELPTDLPTDLYFPLSSLPFTSPVSFASPVPSVSPILSASPVSPLSPVFPSYSYYDVNENSWCNNLESYIELYDLIDLHGDI